MFPLINYGEYLEKTNKKDCRESWVDWKTEIHGMTYMDARKASYDPEWGYKKITERIKR